MPMRRVRRRLATVIGVLVGVGTGCRSDPNANVNRDLSGFTLDVFRQITLEEADDVPIGDVGVFHASPGGGFIIGDRLVPRVHRYDDSGRLLASYGTFGDGPFEFRRVGGLVEDPDGDIVVIDPRRRRATVLTRGLIPDTSFLVSPSPAGPVYGVSDGYIMKILGGRRTSGVSMVSRDWLPLWRIPFPEPSLSVETPYWDSYARRLMAVSSNFVITAHSFLYPIHLHDLHGRPRGSIGSPSPTSVQATIPNKGEFTGAGGAERRRRWLASFTVTANVAVLSDTLLAVTHGRLRLIGASGRVTTQHQSVDLYNLDSRTKIAEHMPLPLGGRVVGGGSQGLYVLADGPPNPWLVSILRPVSTATNLLSEPLSGL